MDCLFCKIIKKEIPAQFIFEDDQVITVNDIAPQAPHHLLIVPKKHIATINDIHTDDNELIGHMMLTAKNLAKKLALADSGYRVIMNCNKNGGQAVYHIHLHLLGGRQMAWPPG